MPWGCQGSGVIGTSGPGIGSCTLAGTFNILNKITPPAPRTQNVQPTSHSPEKNIT